VKKSDFIPYDENAQESTTDAIVIKNEKMNPTTTEFIVELSEPWTSKPGQFMSFLWTDENGSFPRSYSIARENGNQFTFLIKLNPE
jgi:NAD(P)H-flavin reductase